MQLYGKPLSEARKNRFLSAAYQRLNRLPVLKHKAFKTDLRLEGYSKHTFGFRLGPVAELGAVIHDLAHIVEFGDRQFARRTDYDDSLRFHVKRIWVYNQYCVEPTTGQATFRECRTFGIQKRLQERMGLKQTWDNFIKSHFSALEYMPDSYMFLTQKDKNKRITAMYKAYEATTDDMIDSRLKAWFGSIERQAQYRAKKSMKEAALYA